MGDLMEITSWPKHQNVFYRISSSALAFEVKGYGNAVVGLAKKPSHCDYWIAIEDNHKCWIKANDLECKVARLDNADLLSNDEYKRYWIKWNNNAIQLGRDGRTKPFVSYENIEPNLNFVTFTVIEDRNPVHWKFELPPVIPRPRIKTLTDGRLHWEQVETQLPDSAVVGGFENELLYIIRAPHRGSMTPGKFVRSEGLGYVPWGGDSNEKESFEVLCGFDCVWVRSMSNIIPVGAVPGGHTEGELERLYVGRAEHNGHLIPGKIQPSHKVCYIPYQGKEIAKKTFEVLVEPHSNWRCVNKYFVEYMQVDGSEVTDDDDDENHSNDDDWNEEPDMRFAF